MEFADYYFYKIMFSEFSKRILVIWNGAGRYFMAPDLSAVVIKFQQLIFPNEFY